MRRRSGTGGQLEVYKFMGANIVFRRPGDLKDDEELTGVTP